MRPRIATAFTEKTLESYKQLLSAIPPSLNKWKYSTTPPKKAAVLLPLCVINEQASILFTVRSRNLRNHQGEVSFPGGFHEQFDKDIVATALRETKEEIMIEADNITVLGLLNPTTNKNLSTEVTPVVGFLKESNPEKFKWNPDEVENVFTIPCKL
jgi:nudix motif 8